MICQMMMKTKKKNKMLIIKESILGKNKKPHGHQMQGISMFNIIDQKIQIEG